MTDPVRLGIVTQLEPQVYPRQFDKKDLNLAKAIIQNKGVEETFESAVVISAVNADGNGLLASEAAAGMEIAFHTQKHGFEQHLAVVESTGTALYAFPKVVAGGLSLPLDANVTDGVTAAEIGVGSLARCPAAVVAGESPASFIEVTLQMVDVSDLDQLVVGFRKAGAYATTSVGYDDVAGILIGETGATVADGQINIVTKLDGASAVYTDSLLPDLADNTNITLRVVIPRDGDVQFLVDGVQVAAAPRFSFDADEVLVPYVFYSNTAGSTTGDPGIVISSFKAGKF